MTAAKSKKPAAKKKKRSRATIIAKAKLLGGESEVGIPHSNLLAIDDSTEKSFSQANAIEPPLPPLVLVRLVSVSNCLRQNIDAMKTNIHGFGHRFEPAVDFTSQDGIGQIKTAMILEREYEAMDEGEPGAEIPDVPEPSEQEVEERIGQLQERARRELARAKAFFKNVSPDYSFMRLRKRLCMDEESTGYAAWEILRDRRGLPCRINWPQSWTLRALPRDQEPVTVDRLVQVTDIKWETVKEDRFFRRFVQVYEGRTIYFKEFNDPRTVSAETGKTYKDDDELERKEKSARKATEILWFKLDAPESELYGGPRWSGNLLSVIGSREMEEVNVLFWEHKTIPPMAILISGGHLAKGARAKLEAILADHAKGGRENFHKVLLIEAEPIGKGGGGAAGALASQSKVKIELRPLTEAIWKDQLWGEYDKTNRLKVGQSFRIPPIIRGETQDFNRATAEAAKDFVEEQVFQPERTDFDFEINRTLMQSLGITLWLFQTNAPVARQPDKVIAFAKDMVESVVKVNEARRLVQDPLGIDLPKIEEPWGEMPVRQALAGFSAEGEEDYTEEPLDEDEAQNRKKSRRDGWEGLPRETLHVSQSLMDELVETS